ncbi:MAG: hypothetical protein HQK51_13490 [Oligoflexia bacterium]|nr:hypothetical protein [Oligoflexia bacterium]
MKKIKRAFAITIILFNMISICSAAELCPDGVAIKECVKQLRAKLVEVEARINETQQISAPKVISDPNVTVVRRLSVLSFVHPEGASYPSGPDAKAWYHILTPIRVKGSEMFRYDLHGYAYWDSYPIDLTWVGYAYSGSDDFIKTSAVDHNNFALKDPNFKVSMYKTTKGFLVLKFGPMSNYYNSFSLDYQSGSTGEQIGTDHANKNYRVVLSNDDTTLTNL